MFNHRNRTNCIFMDGVEGCKVQGSCISVVSAIFTEMFASFCFKCRALLVCVPCVAFLANQADCAVVVIAVCSMQLSRARANKECLHVISASPVADVEPWCTMLLCILKSALRAYSCTSCVGRQRQASGSNVQVYMPLPFQDHRSTPQDILQLLVRCS